VNERRKMKKPAKERKRKERALKRGFRLLIL
jgi:hypothetical protein